MENHPIRIKRSARVEALGLSPGKELLNVLGRDKPGVGLGCHVLDEEFEDVFVFLVGERFAEGLDVFEECLNGSSKRQRLFVFNAWPGEFEAAVLRAQFKAFAFLPL